MRKIINYLQLNQVGGLELLFAFTPMLSGYGFMGYPLSLLLLPILLFMALKKRTGARYEVFKPVMILLIYVAIHDLVLVLGPGKNFFGYINTLLSLASILYISPVLNFEKLKGSLNLVCIVAIGGLLYQLSFTLAGQGVHPLEIPFLSMSENRLEGLELRPSSFFMEPAAYTAFMFVPMALALIYRQYVWMGLLVFCVFLTGSTTGLLTSFIMIGVYALTQGLKKRYILLMLAMGVVMFYSLENFSIFEEGVTKLQNTDVETNMRLAQGPYVVSTMEPGEYPLGVFYKEVYDYCLSRAPMVHFYTEEVYMSTFWYMTLVYGIIGLLLYLNVYWQLIRRSRLLLPLIVVLLALLFSSGYSLGSAFMFTTISMLAIAYNKDVIEE